MTTGVQGYARTKFLGELDDPLDLNGVGTFMSPAEQRLEVAKNITGSDSVTLANLVSAGTGAAPSGTAGTAGTGATAVEWGNASEHTTVLTLADFAVGTSGDAAALAIGALLYTFPAGDILVDSVQFQDLGITAAISVTTDTPEVGLGTTQASGANATLGAVAATAEDLSEGGDTTNIAPDVAGTATINSSKRPTPASGDDGPKLIKAASAHTVYFNVAVTWANVAAAGAVTADGKVIINWKRLTTS